MRSDSWLEQAIALPLRSLQTFTVDSAVVVAPHPDDETLGCGGAVALLRQTGCLVHVLVISDGTQSHPHSRQYPALALQTLRETETRLAMQLLGVGSENITFLGLPDGAVPGWGSPYFPEALEQCWSYLRDISPQLIFSPYRHDPHPDHRATWQVLEEAIQRLPSLPRRVEYPIWDWDLAQQGDWSELNAWRLDIQPVAVLKARAIAAYQSQITDLIDDDPDGFRLTSDMLANFTRPWEVYLEPA